MTQAQEARVVGYLWALILTRHVPPGAYEIAPLVPVSPIVCGYYGA